MSIYELLVIFVVLLVVFGPEKLPGLAYKIAQYWRAVQAVKTEIHGQMKRELCLEESRQRKKKLQEESRKAFEERNSQQGAGQNSHKNIGEHS